MSEVVESFYLCDRYTVDWEKVDKWFDERIEEIFKEGLKEKRKQKDERRR